MGGGGVDLYWGVALASPRARRITRHTPCDALQVSPDGRILDFWLDEKGARVSAVSSVLEHGGKLWLGNLIGDYVSYISF